jgi:hypothetical protein
MSFTVKPSDIKALEKVFGVKAASVGNSYRFKLGMADPCRRTAVEIYPQIPIGKRRGTLISVFTTNTHLQLHFCSGYVVSESLGEVTFVAEHDGKLAGLIVEKAGGCQLFANVDRTLLSGDFKQLGPEVMLSGVALSLTDTILDLSAASRKPTQRRKAPSRQ